MYRFCDRAARRYRRPEPGIGDYDTPPQLSEFGARRLGTWLGVRGPATSGLEGNFQLPRHECAHGPTLGDRVWPAGSKGLRGTGPACPRIRGRHRAVARTRRIGLGRTQCPHASGCRPRGRRRRRQVTSVSRSGTAARVGGCRRASPRRNRAARSLWRPPRRAPARAENACSRCAPVGSCDAVPRAGDHCDRVYRVDRLADAHDPTARDPPDSALRFIGAAIPDHLLATAGVCV